MTRSNLGKPSDGTTPEIKDPGWRDQSLSESWECTKNGAQAEWHLVAGQSRKIAKKVAARAFAFGHGARTAYARFLAWGRT